MKTMEFHTAWSFYLFPTWPWCWSILRRISRNLHGISWSVHGVFMFFHTWHENSMEYFI